VASLQFVDVVDHYEAMDIFLPVTCHFAAVRRTAEDLAAIMRRLKDLRHAIAEKDSEAMIHTNYDFHVAIAAACHNRSLAKAYSKMLVDTLRVAQHGIRGSEQKRDRSLAGRFRGTLRISEELLRAIADGDGKAAENLARELNTYARQQVIELLSANLSEEIDLPHVTSKGTEILERSSGVAWPLGGKRLNARL
jgi:DNA-binding GntR family transcriptional regulator